MATTQKDIARKLNLSRSLVAGVLNNRTGVWASDETRRRILHAAEEMDYRPNAAAQSLRTGKTCTVAFVYQRPVDESGRIQYSGIVEHLAEGLSQIGYRLLVSVPPDQQAVLEFLTELSTSRACDAFVLWDLEEEVEVQGEHLERQDVPFVAKGRLESRHPHWPQIDFHHEAMMASAVNFLADAGHTRIGYLGRTGDYTFIQCLSRGYQAAMQARFGQLPDPAWMATITIDDVLSAEAQMCRWLTWPPERQPTALVIGANNAAWWGVERALHSVGRRMGPGPEDLAVVGMGWGKDFLHRGEGMKFEDITQIHLASEMTHQLLLPLLHGQRLSSRIVRLEPPLCRVGRLRLNDYYYSLLNEAEMRGLEYPESTATLERRKENG